MKPLSELEWLCSVFQEVILEQLPDGRHCCSVYDRDTDTAFMRVRRGLARAIEVCYKAVKETKIEVKLPEEKE